VALWRPFPSTVLQTLFPVLTTGPSSPSPEREKRERACFEAQPWPGFPPRAELRAGFEQQPFFLTSSNSVVGGDESPTLALVARFASSVNPAVFFSRLARVRFPRGAGPLAAGVPGRWSPCSPRQIAVPSSGMFRIWVRGPGGPSTNRWALDGPLSYLRSSSPYPGPALQTVWVPHHLLLELPRGAGGGGESWNRRHDPGIRQPRSPCR